MKTENFKSKIGRTFTDAVIVPTMVSIKISEGDTGRIQIQSSVYVDENALNDGSDFVEEIFENFIIKKVDIDKILALIETLEKTEISTP